MGRLNINKLLYLLRKNVKWVLPKKMRKPLYLICSVLGLLVYFNFMLKLTGSVYLVQAKKVVLDIYFAVLESTSPALLITLAIILCCVFCSRYFRATASQKDGEKSSYNGSIYYQVNAMISFCYVAITIVGILPILV